MFDSRTLWYETNLDGTKTLWIKMKARDEFRKDLVLGTVTSVTSAVSALIFYNLVQGLI